MKCANLMALGPTGHTMPNNRWLLFGPALLLAGAVLLSRLSGNDKSPFIVLAVLVVLVLGFAVALVVFLLSGFSRSQAGWLSAGFLLPMAYAALVLAMARAGLIDPLVWLGFR